MDFECPLYDDPYAVTDMTFFLTERADLVFYLSWHLPTMVNFDLYQLYFFKLFRLSILSAWLYENHLQVISLLNNGHFLYPQMLMNAIKQSLVLQILFAKTWKAATTVNAI